MSEKNSFQNTVESLFKGMDSFITSKTVVGDPIQFGDTIILPLIDVSFGVGAGAFGDEKKNNGAGGMGGKITPSSVLVVQGDKIRLVNIKNQDGITKILDLVPDLVDRVVSAKSGKKHSEKDKEEAKETLSQQISNAVKDAQEKEDSDPEGK